MPSRYVLKSRRIFLTYARTDSGAGETPADPPQFTKQSLFDFLKGRTGGSILVAQEEHSDGGTHFHAYISLEEALHVRDPRFFDFCSKHPNIQSVRNVKAVIKYTQKEDNWIADPEIISGIQEVCKPSYGELLQRSTSATDFLSRLQHSYPRDFVLNYHRIKAMASEFYRNRQEVYSTPLDIQFNTPLLLTQWRAENLDGLQHRPRSLILCGKSRLGKTLWARSLGPHIYFNNYFNIDKISDDAKYAVFDDITFEQMERQWKSWMGAQQEFEATDKYRGKRTIYWGKPCIFVCNNLPHFPYILQEWNNENIDIVEIAEPLFQIKTN